jgi:RNA polymerase sigma-70 factor (ECF subfamily)
VPRPCNSFARERGRPFAPLGRLALVNGAIGVVAGPVDAPIAVASCTIVNGRIVALDPIVDRQKLAGLEIA